MLGVLVQGSNALFQREKGLVDFSTFQTRASIVGSCVCSPLAPGKVDEGEFSMPDDWVGCVFTL